MTRKQQTEILMARQPIFDRNMKVVAYELLYRASDGSGFSAILDGDQASSQVLLNGYTSIVEGSKQCSVPAFVNLTQEMIESNRLPCISREHIVIELLEDIVATPEVIKAVEQLVKSGYRVALDDFTYDDSFIPLLKLAQIVKVDLTLTRGDELVKLLKRLTPYKLTLLAEKIETHEELEQCKALGFKLFQGYFLSKPSIVSGKKLSGNTMIIMQLLVALADEKTTPTDLEQIITRDPSLTFQLLKIVNSSLYSLAKNIDSIAQAVVILGANEIKKWVTLIALANNSNKPSELTRHTLVTAHMCERIAREQRNSTSNAFMAGLLSCLDALLDISHDTLFSEISIHPDIVNAIISHEGNCGLILKNTQNYIKGDWNSLEEGIDLSLYKESYDEAVAWAHESMSIMSH